MNYPLITKPEKESEFEMQADLYFRLIQIGLDVRGEVPSKHNGRRSYFDLVVFIGGHGAVVIEVKNSQCNAIRHGKKTRQMTRYREYGLPLILYTTATPIESVILKVQEAVNSILSPP